MRARALSCGQAKLPFQTLVLIGHGILALAILVRMLALLPLPIEATAESLLGEELGAALTLAWRVHR